MSDEQNSPVNSSPEGPAPAQPSPPSAPPQKDKKEAGKVLMQEITPDLSAASRRRRIFQTLVIPLLAILTGYKRSLLHRTFFGIASIPFEEQFLPFTAALATD